MHAHAQEETHARARRPKMKWNHTSQYDEHQAEAEENTGEKLVVEELSMTLQEAVASLAIRGDILQARRGAVGGYSLDKESAESLIDRAEKSPIFMERIERMQRRRQALIELDKINQLTLKNNEKVSMSD